MMIRKTYPLANRLAKGSLIQRYIAKDESVRPLINEFPSIDAFQDLIRERNFPEHHRKVLVDELRDQYRDIGDREQVDRNLDLLSQSNTFTITTGHQLCLGTGPLFFLYKIASAIKMTQQLSQRYPEQNFVPIYWMATEDHDFEEINHLHLFGKKVAWEIESNGAVGRLTLNTLTDWLEEVKSIIGEGTIDKAYLIDLFEKAYRLPNLADATRYFVHQLFGRFGLVIIDSDTTKFKQLFIPVLEQELKDNFSFKAVEQTVEDWEETPQVTARSINLFYLKEDYRVRIESEENTWFTTDNQYQWNEQELLEEVQNHPERFSPNVVLRPLYQEIILPNLAYIGGPGETSYWLELKQVFEQAETPFPLLIFRDTQVLINQGIIKKMEQFEWDVDDLFRNVDELIREELEKNPLNIDVNYLKNKWEKDVADLQSEVQVIDPNLKKSIESEWTKIQKSIDNINQKITKGIKRKEEGTVKQIRTTIGKLFPNQVPQERYDNFIPYYLASEGKLIDNLIEIADPLSEEFRVVEV